MKFIEMTGKTLAAIVKDVEFTAAGLETSGVLDETIVRINEHGDIEIRHTNKWSVIGGLLGDYENRIKNRTGMEWV